MTIAPSAYADFVGKDVLLTVEGEAEPIEGKIEQASEAGIAFKRRGRRDIEPYFPDTIVNITEQEKKASKIKQKKQLPVADERVKAHLASAHGMRLSEVNALSQEDAVKHHDSIDHKDLGHNHDKDPNEKADEKADAASE